MPAAAVVVVVVVIMVMMMVVVASVAMTVMVLLPTSDASQDARGGFVTVVTTMCYELDDVLHAKCPLTGDNQTWKYNSASVSLYLKRQMSPAE